MTKVQRYKVGFFSDEWGMSSNTPCLIPDDSGYAVKFEDYCKLEAENERLERNLSTTEQTMREYQELAAKRLKEIAKYRDAPIAAYGVLEDQGSSVISWDFIAGWSEAAHEHINDAIQIWKDSGDFVPKYSVVPLIVKPGEEK